ncbi:MAG: ABC transporter ATP-binding protein [Elusimicrobia bacterium]|nr:ABC transporter ATP-binding protein [Elusimicrobiota bacterium]
MLKLKDLNFCVAPGFNLSIDNLEVGEGEILAVIGPNGAGKTSLLNVLALFRKAGAGSLEMFGKNAYNPADKMFLRRSMSFVFSQPYLLNDTVYDNVALPLKLRGGRDDARVSGMLELFKIAGLKDRNANLLSQGEKHRVALARAFVTRPRLILLDEPFLSLDARVKESIMRDLRHIIKASGAAVIFVTQDQTEALALCDSMAVMMNGRIVQRGSPQEVFARPASKEAADFVGVETILEGKIVKKSENLCSIKVNGQSLEVVSEYNEGDSVFVCVRPEDVSVSKSADVNSMRNHFKAKITFMEPWRLEYKLSLDCGFSLIAAVTKQSVEGLGFKMGAEVFASFKATAAHLIKR